MLTLTEDEITKLEEADVRIKVIRERLNKQGSMPWAFHNTAGEEVVRIPPQPNRFQRSFIGWAPEDIGYLLDLNVALMDVLARAQRQPEEAAHVDAPSADGADGGDDGGARRPARGRKAKSG